MSAKKRALAEIITITVSFVALIFAGTALIGLICNKGLEKYLFVIELGVYILDIISVILVIKLFRDPEKNLGFSKTNIFRQVLWSVPLLTGMFAIYKLFGCSVEGSEFSLNLQSVYYLFYLLLVAVGEELIFRGLIYNKFFEITENRIAAVAVSSLMFGAAHFMVGDLSGMIMSAAAGVLLCSAKVWFRDCTLLSTIIAHWLYNYLMMYISI